jgi:N utilization substance protein A
MVVSELRGEKIDIIPFNDEPARFVAKALSPARVREVLVDDDAKQATVIVPDDQLSLAIGREGQNARLAARLTGWRVDIRSETEFAAEEAEHGYEEEEVAGRCAAILSNGRRCPNAALPGSRYCGLETHQALANIDSDNIGDLNAEGSEAEAVPAAAVAAAANGDSAAGEPASHEVREEQILDEGPLPETEAAVIAPDPEETGEEAEREVAEKLESAEDAPEGSAT